MDKLCRPQPGYADWRREYAGLEYGIMAAVMVGVLGAAFSGVAGHLTTLFTAIGGKLTLS
jgi:Flp pilus assembly pilin Flp